MQTVLLVLFVINAVTLVVFVLLQQGKGADAGAAFGSGASATVFGARGSANFLSRTTAVLATLFFVLAMILAYLSQTPREVGSVAERAAGSVPTVVAPPVVTQAPATVEAAADEEEPEQVPPPEEGGGE